MFIQGKDFGGFILRAGGPGASLLWDGGVSRWGIPHVVIRGYDVSHHQGVFDHARAAREGFDFCVVKATEGATFKDPNFDENWGTLADVGLARGAYHFGRPGSNSAKAEAEFYLETVELASEHIRPILDLEGFGRESLGPTSLAEWIQDWVEEVVEATGKRAIIYTRQFWITHLGASTDNFDTDLWSRATPTPCWIRSYRERGTVTCCGNGLGAPARISFRMRSHPCCASSAPTRSSQLPAGRWTKTWGQPG